MSADQAVPPTLSSRGIRVVLVEDDPGTREILLELLCHSPALSWVGAYGDRDEAEREIPQVLPDVVLMDINLDGESGIGCVRRLKSAHPDIVFLMLTNYDDDALIFESLRVGASGYLLKRYASAELIAAIEEGYRGGVPMSSQVARKVVTHFHSRPPQTEVPQLSATKTSAEKSKTDRKVYIPPPEIEGTI